MWLEVLVVKETEDGNKEMSRSDKGAA